MGHAGCTAFDNIFVPGTAGSRASLSEWVTELERSGVNALARRVLPRCRPVRVVAFDKTSDSNWALGWHQDRVIAVQARADASGFSNWTCKAGVWHVEPPIALLENMIFVRVHLDDATRDNGCLELALGTHRQGRIAAAGAAAVAQEVSTEFCEARRGDILIAKALILHRSRPSRAAGGRRAIRIDYSADDLPPPLQWTA